MKKKDILVLTVLNDILEDGYEILDSDDITSNAQLEGITIESFWETIKELDVANYISLKYASNDQFCLAITPQGRHKVKEFKTIPIAKLHENAVIKTDIAGNNIIAISTDESDETNQQIIDELMPAPVQITTKPTKFQWIKTFFVGILGGFMGGLGSFGIMFAIMHGLGLI